MVAIVDFRHSKYYSIDSWQRLDFQMQRAFTLALHLLIEYNSAGLCILVHLISQFYSSSLIYIPFMIKHFNLFDFSILHHLFLSNVFMKKRRRKKRTSSFAIAIVTVLFFVSYFLNPSRAVIFYLFQLQPSLSSPIDTTSLILSPPPTTFGTIGCRAELVSLADPCLS